MPSWSCWWWFIPRNSSFFDVFLLVFPFCWYYILYAFSWPLENFKFLFSDRWFYEQIFHNQKTKRFSKVYSCNYLLLLPDGDWLLISLLGFRKLWDSGYLSVRKRLVRVVNRARSSSIYLNLLWEVGKKDWFFWGNADEIVKNFLHRS